jgi:hypothetical protein
MGNKKKQRNKKTSLKRINNRERKKKYLTITRGYKKEYIRDKRKTKKLSKRIKAD